MTTMDFVNYRVPKPVFFELRIVRISINLQLKNEQSIDFEVNEKTENRNECKNYWREVGLIDFGFILNLVECSFYVCFCAIVLFDSVLNLLWAYDKNEIIKKVESVEKKL